MSLRGSRAAVFPFVRTVFTNDVTAEACVSCIWLSYSYA